MSDPNPDAFGLLPLRKREYGSRLFSLDDVERRWEPLWEGMPAFEMGDTDAVQKILVCFRSREDVERFAALIGDQAWTNGIGSKITERTDSMWFGGRDPDYVAPKELLWVSDAHNIPRYPIYIPSVGRWDTSLTARALEAINVPHRVVVEPAQYDDYARVLGADRLLVLPEDYSASGTGAAPVRNWIWEHSLADGHVRHWALDDNIKGFLRMHRNRRIPVADGAIFCAAEDFTDRYENIAFSGFNYMWLAKDRQEAMPPIQMNSRIYSMILHNNALPYRYRGVHQEDTDICLCALKDGWCTVLFNAFLGDKTTTMTMKGGNSPRYLADRIDTAKFAQILAEQHPDVARVVWRYERWHHEVDYSGFRRNKLVPRESIVPPADPEYGMQLVKTPGRRSRYPRLQTAGIENGNIEDGTTGGDQEGAPGDVEAGDVRAVEPDRVRRGARGHVQRPGGDNPPPAWRP